MIVSDSLDFADFRIGESGIIVELYKLKKGKNKYHKCHPIKRAWILGDVERTNKSNIFLQRFKTDRQMLWLI
ncbi:hypothetical protein HZS_5632 [Henneguya salminicola]|nr:hypothetical protein HZS_5632 [Henneguya salminicola]